VEKLFYVGWQATWSDSRDSIFDGSLVPVVRWSDTKRCTIIMFRIMLMCVVLQSGQWTPVDAVAAGTCSVHVGQPGLLDTPTANHSTTTPMMPLVAAHAHSQPQTADNSSIMLLR